MDWLREDGTSREFLRKTCINALQGKLPLGAEIGVAAEDMPLWVVRTVELTIVHGLIAGRDVQRANVLVDIDDRDAWQRLQQLGGPWSALVIDDGGPATQPRVRRLFDGRIDPKGHVHFRPWSSDRFLRRHSTSFRCWRPTAARSDRSTTRSSRTRAARLP